MKNIHVLRTNKPSRLTLIENKLLLSHAVNWESKPIDWEEGDGVNQYIYITSDEEIKEGDWCLLDNNVGESTGYEIKQCLEADILNGEYTFKEDDGSLFTTGRCEKIILTTDESLDGVQPISNEFLKWFVKNPSCEEVEIESWQTKGEWDLDYKIIIPKEEPKQEFCDNCNNDVCCCTVKKQETLEEAACNYIKSDLKKTPLYGMFNDTFIAGAKWQEKRMYSEEEVKHIISEALESALVTVDLEQWFEQFKKK